MNSKSVISNLIWRFSERIGAQFVAFVVSIVLARLLEPSAYGTVALITVFTSILQVFVDSGLGNALIQKKEADNVDFSTVFYTNIIFCIFLYFLLYCISPVIAQFYNDDSISKYMRILGITILLSGIKNVQQAYVSKNMLFERFFFSTLGGTIIAGIVGISMAIKGFGVWALVVQHVTNLTIDTLILWLTVKWRPGLVFSWKRLKGLFSFGWKLLLSRLIDAIYSDIRQLLIGKIYSPSDLAQYNRGRNFPNLIIYNINSSIDSVLLPAMSNVQDNREKVKNMTRRSIKMSVFIMAPAMIGLASVGNQVVKLLLTDKWLPSVFFMRIFCFTFLFYPIHTANLNAIKALGRSDLFLKLEIEKKIIGICLLLATMFISVKAMALSLIVSSITSQLINATPNKKLLNYGYIDQLKDILPSICLACFMGMLIIPISMLRISNIMILLIQMMVGGTIYILGAKLLKLDSLEYVIGVMTHLLKKEKKTYE